MKRAVFFWPIIITRERTVGHPKPDHVVPPYDEQTLTITITLHSLSEPFRMQCSAMQWNAPPSPRWNGGFTMERRFRDAKPPHLDGLQRTSSAHWTVCGLSRARECVDGNATQRNGIARARLERVRCAAAARLHLDQLVRRRHLRHRAASSRRRDAHGRASISTSSCDHRHL